MNFINYLILLVCISGCAGSIQTNQLSSDTKKAIRKAYIVSAENSAYIKFKFGVITPVGYFIPEDGPAENREAIGNTAQVIKAELERYGIEAEIGNKEDQPDGFDLIVVYKDTWRWDFKKVLDKLEIYFISSDGEELLAQSTYTIYKNKELHNFPSPEKEVPKMIRELLTSDY